ncbi:MAG TPA: FtsX-like permease family protein [Gemmatimonadales bacterium]|nr:FtsX-like permease family protein [Gemmatimonadales bacterium]
MIGPRFVLRMAWRESRAGRKRLWLLTGAVTAGVAALVAINSFTQNLRTSVAEQARALLGSDIAFESRQRFSARMEALLDTLVRADSAGGIAGRRADVANFAGMAYVPRTAGVRLVQVRAVEPGYPFYGAITTNPAGRWAELTRLGGAIVEPSLLSALGARLGDTLALGRARFPIIGTVLNIPGDVGVAAAFGARVFIPAESIDATGLLQFGSRAEYQAFVQLPPGTDAEKLRERYRRPLREERVRVRTVEDDQEDLTSALTQLGNYLGLVALVALLLGGLGVASAVHVFIKRKLDTIAVLRCLGASAPQVFAIYLLQSLVMGGLGSALGAVLGVALQQVLPVLFRDLLPVDVRVTPSPGSILLGMTLGLWVAGIFAALPLVGVRNVSPLVTLRREVDPPKRRRDLLTWTAAVLLAASVVALSVIQVEQVVQGSIFAGAVGAGILVLWLSARGLIRAVRRWFPHRWPYLWRQGLANLYRPANQTVTVVLALGFGASLLTTLFLVQHNLLREFRIGGATGRPNLMFFDIQPSQREGVERTLVESGHPGTPMVPVVSMRIKAIRDVPVRTLVAQDSAAADTAAGSGRQARRDGPDGGPSPWAIRREYRSTYRDSLTDTETLTEGAWWPRGGGPRRENDPWRISVEADIARELGVKLGDGILWDVSGIEVDTRVASIREVDWGRFQTNFFVVFEPGALERAPQMMVTLVRIDSSDVRGLVQRRMAEQFPNVTAIDLSQIQSALDNIIGKAALIVRFLAGFSLVTGAVVLIGAVSASRLQRIREAVLLKTLGATRSQVLRILIAEYAALGVLSAVASIAIASIAGWALARWVFDSPFRLPALQLFALTLLLVTLTLAVGLWNSAEILKRAPLAVLREE